MSGQDQEPERPLVPELDGHAVTQLSDLLLNRELSDIQLRNPDTMVAQPAHQAIVASGSQYFLSLFLEAKKKDDGKGLEPLVAGLDYPKPVETAQNPRGLCSDEVVNIILKFLYNNQDFAGIKAAITEQNVMALYSQAYMLRCINLMRSLEEMVVNELVNPSNATIFYVDAILFECQPIFEACETIIQFNIEKIIDDEKASEFLMTLPFERMRSLCKDDKLHVNNEGQLLKLVDRYLQFRAAKEDLATPAEDADGITGAKKDWAALLAAGVLTEQEAKDKEAKEIADAKEAEEADKKAKEEAETALAADKDDLWKANRPYHLANEKVRAACAGRLALSALSKREQRELYGCVRFVHMAHEELVPMCQDAKYAICRDQITEALSFKLSRYETGIKENLKHNNADFRVNHEPSPEEKALQESVSAASNPLLTQQSQAAQQPAGTALGQLMQSAFLNKSAAQTMQPPGRNAYGQYGAPGHWPKPPRRSPSKDKHKKDPIGYKPVEMGNPDHPNPHLRMSMAENYYARKMEEEKAAQQNLSRKLVAATLQEGIGKKFREAAGASAGWQMQPGVPYGGMTQAGYMQPGYPSYADPYQTLQPMGGDAMLASQQAAAGAPSKTMKPSAGPIAPMKPHKGQIADAQDQLQSRPYEFVFQHSFDEEGALYFLGSFGKRRLYQNPHILGQVQAFSSSIGSGRPEDVVGRAVVNCRTGNEPYSYFGIDLGEGRQLLPTCYSLRNRNSTTHIMLNWHFEGSNDKVNWTVLDRRLYLTGNPAEDSAFEEEKKLLCAKGAATTWGVDTDIYREIGFDGFRYFRIIQVGKNSSGSDNLALSGLELYGRVIAGRWP